MFSHFFLKTSVFNVFLQFYKNMFVFITGLGVKGAILKGKFHTDTNKIFSSQKVCPS